MMLAIRRRSERRGHGRRRAARTWIAAALILSSATVLAATRPPKNLKKVGDHWTPWDPPAAGPDDYIIQKDDTLWDLAGKWLGNPYLWPQIWEENRYILDSHWIYPGDPLVVPGRPTIVPSDETPPVGDLGDASRQVEEPAAEAPPEVAVVPEKPLVAAADLADLYCSGYIDRFPVEPAVRLLRGSSEKVHQGQGDVVYLTAGRDAGVEPGTQYAIIRSTYTVEHPVTEEVLGTFVRRLGKATVMLVHDTSSTAVIDFSCEDVVPGDALVPWADIPVPMMAELPAFDRWQTDSLMMAESGGYIVTFIDRLTAAGTGHLIYVDMGQDEGLRPGDVLTLYREQEAYEDPEDYREGRDDEEDEEDEEDAKADVAEPQLPPLMLGQAVVLTVEAETATAKIVQSVQEAYVGDRVEPSR
jgi:hypothetical protein